MKIAQTTAEMQALARGWRRAGLRIGLVPTMGYLHDGHLALVRCARERADLVVVSIFVNPTQFGPREDFAAYPRDFARDEQLCRDAGVAAIFAPAPADMYAPDHTVWVVEDELARPLCGASRPGHFRGVLTVVAKLFNAVLPDLAVFGQKDAQQALLIERLVRDLNFPLTVVVLPTVRETDGLAMSSRNAYLSADERARAPAIYAALVEAQQRLVAGERSAADLTGQVRRRIEAAGGRIDYVELVARQDLRPLPTVDRPALLAVAAVFGRTRLIDNVFLDTLDRPTVDT